MPMLYVHPGKLTWNLKITCLKREIIFQNSIFGFHVNFQGCIILQPSEKLCANPIRTLQVPAPSAPWSYTVAHAPSRSCCEGVAATDKRGKIWSEKNATILPSLFLGVGKWWGKTICKNTISSSQGSGWRYCPLSSASWRFALWLCCTIAMLHITRILRVMFHLRSVHVFCGTHLHRH